MFYELLNSKGHGFVSILWEVSAEACSRKGATFPVEGMGAGLFMREPGIRRTLLPHAAPYGLSAGNAARRDVIAVPVVDGKRFYAHPGAGLGAVHEVVLPDVDAGVVAGTGNPEDYDVSGAQTVAGNALTGIGLIAADAGNADAVAGAGPVHETGAVESLGGRGSAENIRTAELTFCRGGDGCSAAAGRIDLRSGVLVRSIGLFAAAGGQNHGCAQKQQWKESGKGGDAKCRHGCPAELSRYRFNISFLDHKEKKCKRNPVGRTA